ncbi:MAG: putative nucleotidyltransferase [Candidatus Promineifilaceae bacterium]|jgi:predicted nucleotidyltransferase
MTNTCIQLSTPLDTRIAESLAHLAELFQKENVSYFLLGATARDIIFHHVAGCDASPRRTFDIDISIQMDSWESYNTVRESMLLAGYACSDESHPEKLIDTTTNMEIDMLPFGNISENGESIVWPTDSSSWSIVGFNEAYRNAIAHDLGSSTLRIATPASMIYLKMIAVYDRPEARRKKDSVDIFYTIQNYDRVATKLVSGSRKRYQLALEETEGDLLLANALIAGNDIRQMAEKNTPNRILEILKVETESASRCEIAHELRACLDGNFTRARAVLRMLKQGVEGIKRL